MCVLPLLKAAAEALNTLNKSNLTELKSFGKPPPAVVNVTAAVMVLLAPATKIPKDRSWNAAKVMMGKVHLINIESESHLHVFVLCDNVHFVCKGGPIFRCADQL